MARDPKPGFRFPGPVPREALEWFRDRDLRVGFDHRDVWGIEHSHSLTVAKVVQLDILDDFGRALSEHLEGGGTLRSFTRELTPILQRKGWWGRREVIDPRTGETVEAQLGSPRRLRVIYESNMRAARAAGQWARIQRTKRTHPYLLYTLGPSREHRDQHVAWAGTLLPADHDWWHDHFPPNGWGCKCRVRQVSEAEAERLGGVTPAPARDLRRWTNPRSGKTMRVDRGLDPAWASNPGRDRERILADSLAGRLEAADEALARAAVRQVVDSPLLERQLARMKKADPPKGDLPVGWLEPALRPELGIAQRVIRLDQRGAKHLRRRWGETEAARIVRSVLPGLLEAPELVLRVEGHRYHPGVNLVYFGVAADGRMLKVAVHRDGDHLGAVSGLHREGIAGGPAGAGVSAGIPHLASLPAGACAF